MGSIILDSNFAPVVSPSERTSLIESFDLGYLFDEADPNSPRIHSLRIPALINLAGNRKTVFSIEQLSDTLFETSLWLYGSEMDAKEWNQQGIKKTELVFFKNFLRQLFDSFEFALGMVAYENSTVLLFNVQEGWPHPKYDLKKIDLEAISSKTDYELIIINRNLPSLGDIQGAKTKGQRLELDREY